MIAIFQVEYEWTPPSSISEKQCSEELRMGLVTLFHYCHILSFFVLLGLSGLRLISLVVVGSCFVEGHLPNYIYNIRILSQIPLILHVAPNPVSFFKAETDDLCLILISQIPSCSELWEEFLWVCESTKSVSLFSKWRQNRKGISFHFPGHPRSDEGQISPFSCPQGCGLPLPYVFGMSLLLPLDLRHKQTPRPK